MITPWHTYKFKKKKKKIKKVKFTFALTVSSILLNKSLYILAIGTRSAFFSMKAAELKSQNLTVKKVCQVEHFTTFCKANGPELGL